MRAPASESIVLSFLLSLPTLGAAQAPVITPAGDPSVQNDTIYSLAVDPAQHPDDPYVVLLDDGVLRYEADGRSARSYRQVIQVLSSDAVDNFAEHEFSYAPGHQRLTVNWIRVLRTDGTVISETPTQVQDADVPATLGDPVYNDRKVRRYSLSGVAPGTIVDWSYTLEELKPYLPGDFYASWSVHNARLTRRSRYLVDLPASIKPHLVERNLTFARQIREVDGRRVYLWATSDVEPVTPEDFASDSNGVYMGIEISGPITWEKIGRWYAGLAKGRYAVSSSVTDRLPALLADSRSAEDSLRAIYRWVSQDIRYVSIALGIGGYQPRLPADVIGTGYGDCKDKATLFVAVANHLGFHALPVLLNGGGDVDRDTPALEQFDHAIAVVERPHGRIFADLTADLTPFGQLPPSDQGQFALIIHPDGATEETTIPPDAPGANLAETSITGTLSADGLLTGVYQERAEGSRQYGLRKLFLSPIDSAQRAEFARSIATKIYPGAEADSLQIFDGRDLSADPHVSLRILHGQAARPAGAGGTMILELPFGSMRSLGDAATALAAKGPRRFPIDAEKVIGASEGVSKMVLVLPHGWHAQLPPPVEASGKFGDYSSRLSQSGDTLRLERRIEGKRGIYPPAALPELIDWFKAVARDDSPYLLLQPGNSP
ncbi:MAG TPA: DUF3857 domain-containing protein [Gemmatimonadales bacterium]|nr:DUF3857 domain-containing protein [Gemmatimonadales bacterium]